MFEYMLNGLLLLSSGSLANVAYISFYVSPSVLNFFIMKRLKLGCNSGGGEDWQETGLRQTPGSVAEGPMRKDLGRTTAPSTVRGTARGLTTQAESSESSSFSI